MRQRRAPALAVLLAGAGALTATARTQGPEGYDELRAELHATGERGVVALRQAIGDAGNDGLALLLASHADDRWVLPAAALRFQHHWHVATLLLTRGEGGQNSRGPATGDALGAIRTLEAQISAARFGVEIHYLNRADAGFCRSAVEAFEVWGLRRTIADLARALRRIRPDLILTTHDPKETHGHDQALLTVLLPAVDLAIEAEFMTPGLAPIRPPRVFRGAAVGETPHFVMQFDRVDSLRGETLRRLAYAALQAQRSQTPLPPIDEHLAPELGLVELPVGGKDVRADPTPFASPPSLLAALAPGQASELDAATRRLGASEQDAREILLAALELHRRLQALELPPDSPAAARRERRLRRAADVVRLASGVHVLAEGIGDQAAVPGGSWPLRLQLRNSGPLPIDVRQLRSAAGELSWIEGGPGALAPQGELSLAGALQVGKEVPDRDATLRTLFQRQTWTPPLSLTIELGIGEAGVVVDVPLPADVRAGVELQVVPRALLLAAGRRQATFAVHVERHARQPLHETLRVAAPAGFVVEPPFETLAMQMETHRIATFTVQAPVGLRPGVYSLQVQCAGRTLQVPVHRLDVSIPPQLRVGLVRGVDASAQDVLTGLGAELTLLTDEQLAVRPLGDLDTIVCDIRSLHLRPAAKAAFPRLLRFVQSGGRLVVCYHKDLEFNVEHAGFLGAPFDLHIGKGRVTREDAPVTILLPAHSLLTSPNAIGSKDWDGWVHERGLYFPDRFDDGYDKLLEVHDPDQPAERGALLYTSYGRGDYVYCALALHRQLRNLHEGTCRLFANLISPKRK